jgi:2-oxoglutarate dehydrogenase E1 component
LKEAIWCQEEPANQGAWLPIKNRFLRRLFQRDVKLTYVGRPSSAAPAVGKFKRHMIQQKKIIDDALFAEPSSSH